MYIHCQIILTVICIYQSIIKSESNMSNNLYNQPSLAKLINISRKAVRLACQHEFLKTCLQEEFLPNGIDDQTDFKVSNDDQQL